MDFRIFVEPQLGATYGDQLALAQAAEALGFDAFFRSDHYMRSGEPSAGLPGPTDSWVTLGALARETSSIRLGTLVSSATHRAPSILAIQVAQVDEMSGGRVELGLGTGWNKEEHVAYGIPFPAKRFGMLEEQLQIVTGLWDTPVGETYSFVGEHYTLASAPALPKPVQHPLPIIIGGSGPSRTPALAARFAHEYNSWIGPETAAHLSRVRAACEAIGRDPESIVMSIAATTATGATTADVSRRAEASGSTVENLVAGGLGGSAAQVVDRIGELQALGVSRVYFQLIDMHDLDHAEFIAREILPQLK